MAAADEAMAVKAVFDKTTRTAIRGAKRRGSEDPAFQISKQLLVEAEIGASPSPGPPFLVRKPAACTDAILARLEQLEEGSKQQQAFNTKLQANSKWLQELSANLQVDFKRQQEFNKKLQVDFQLQQGFNEKLQADSQRQQEVVAKLRLRVDLMDLKNYDLYTEKIGARRRVVVVAYGILEYVHHKYLTAFARTAIQERCAKISTNEKNLYLEFLNKEVFSRKWQEGSYEEVNAAWTGRSRKSFSDNEVAWLEEILTKAENTFIAMGAQSNDLTALNPMDLRIALGRVLSLERHKRNEAYNSLCVGEDRICLEVIEDLTAVLDKGHLSEHKEVVEILRFGCKLYKGYKSRE